ncbi:tRNA (guanine-N1)-methyltransferase [Candidatus Thiomargarita nelsonii]|uniref:tRNA (guanine-N(1)-)-methyltransferase n=1 Tax=Candidatus Thiomargarita nelsonii TaxID=1003181 RepID=A0A0A6PGB2_9GAMM|nr:tRNA (guanine-N1)-methyltransferase [Candidatus Thiomargarita nelsonii]
MHIGVISLFPEMLDALRCGGVTARALEKGLLKLSTWNPRDFSPEKHHHVDDRPYGGGPGMVMQVQPLRDAIRAAVTKMGAETRVIYLTPQGRRLDQAGVRILLESKALALVAGRYEGIDERLIERDIDEEWSIGDYVLSGGELAAMVIIDALARQLPGTLGHEASAAEDSFYAGLLDYPHYTRPEEIDGQAVPAVLLSGNHAEIARWRHKQALGRTWCRYPELLDKLSLSAEQKALLNEFIDESVNALLPKEKT